MTSSWEWTCSVVGLGEDRADRGGDHLGVAPRDPGQHVAQEVDPAPLPGRAGEHRADRGLEAFVGVGDHQLHPVQPAGLQRPQERGPERSVLAVADVEPEHLPVPVRADRGGDHDGLGDDPPVDPGLAVGGVEKHVRVRVALQRPAPERGDLLIQVLADPRHLGLGDAGVDAEGLDQVVDLPGGDAVQVRLHDHRVQGLVDPAAPLQQRREERLRSAASGSAAPDPRPSSTTLSAGDRCAARSGHRCVRAVRRRSPRSARPRSTPGRSSPPTPGPGRPHRPP